MRDGDGYLRFDASDANNYGSIFVLTCLCKTLDRMVIGGIVGLMLANDPMSCIQCGFRRNRSTLNSPKRNSAHLCCKYFDHNEPNVTLDDTKVQVVPEAKFLVVTFY